MLDLGWIHEENAPALLRFLAEQLWHDVSEEEWLSILRALNASNALKGLWVELPLGPILSLNVARDEPGSAKVLIRAEGDDGWISHLRGLMLFLRRYLVSGEA
jgi:hypothetical protein